MRKLLAEDTSQVVWLHPGENGVFTPESLPEDSFRPLWDWIDYVLDHEKEPLQAWVQAAQFDFEPFVCDDDPTTRPRKPPSEGKSKPSRERNTNRDGDRDVIAYAPVEEARLDEEKPAIDEFGSVVKVEPDVIQKELRALEESFLTLEGGLDTPERQEMWPRLASLNGQLKNVDDAGVCWMNALWERDEQAARAWSWNWFAAEAADVPPRQDTARSQPRAWVSRVLSGQAKTTEVSGEDLDRLLALDEPATADLRALAAYVTHTALQNPPSQALVSRIGQVSRFLEAHERLLPVRAVWLVWLHLTLLSRGDVLALARARDRLLERLYHNGLRPELDLPSFLRFAGQPTSQRFRAVRQWMTDLAGLAQDWIKEGGSPNATAQTPAYVDLVFAFGLARLGENDAARDLLTRAKTVLSSKDDAHSFLYGAFEHRVEQALDGKPHTGALPNDQLEYLEHMERLLRYVVDRLRKHSRILEPDQRINPYRHWSARISEFEKALAELTDLTDRNELAIRVEKLLREVPKGAKGNEQRARVLRAGLEAAPRVGEDFARKMLEQTVPAYDAPARSEGAGCPVASGGVPGEGAVRRRPFRAGGVGSSTGDALPAHAPGAEGTTGAPGAGLAGSAVLPRLTQARHARRDRPDPSADGRLGVGGTGRQGDRFQEARPGGSRLACSAPGGGKLLLLRRATARRSRFSRPLAVCCWQVSCHRASRRSWRAPTPAPSARRRWKWPRSAWRKSSASSRGLRTPTPPRRTSACRSSTWSRRSCWR